HPPRRAGQGRTGGAADGRGQPVAGLALAGGSPLSPPRRRSPRRPGLGVGAAVVGAVALLAVVGRITGPEPPAPRAGPAPATTRAPAQRPPPPQRGVAAPLEGGHGGGP